MDNDTIYCTDFHTMSIAKLDYFITLLQEYQLQCELKGKFIEAEMCEQRINQLKEIIEKKEKVKIKKAYTQQKIQLEKQNKENMLQYNQEINAEMMEKEHIFYMEEQALKEKHKVEIEERMQRFAEENIQLNNKTNRHLIKLNHMLQAAVKLKQYTQAHQIQGEITEASKIRDMQYEEAQNKKMEFELMRLKKKHQNELLNHRIKFRNSYDNLLCIKIEQMKKFKKKEHSIITELQNTQKMEKTYVYKIRTEGIKASDKGRFLVRSASELGRQRPMMNID